MWGTFQRLQPTCVFRYSNSYLTCQGLSVGIASVAKYVNPRYTFRKCRKLNEWVHRLRTPITNQTLARILFFPDSNTLSAVAAGPRWHFVFPDININSHPSSYSLKYMGVLFFLKYSFLTIWPCVALGKDWGNTITCGFAGSFFWRRTQRLSGVNAFRF